MEENTTVAEEQVAPKGLTDLGPKRHLLMACGAKKKQSSEKIDALERYDGPFHSMVRKYRAAGFVNLDVTILSAKHGILWSDTQIGNYDQKMTKDRATELKEVVAERLEELANKGEVKELFVCLGQTYLGALPNLEDIFPGAHITYSKGSLGLHLQGLRRWLYEVEPIVPEAPKLAPPQTKTKTTRARVQRNTTMAEETTGATTVAKRVTLAVAMAALALNLEGATSTLRDAFVSEVPLANGNRKSDPKHWNVVLDLPSYQDHKETVGEGEAAKEVVTSKPTGDPVPTRVGVSWAAKTLTNMDRSEFTTADAVAALQKIGFTIENDGTPYIPVVKESKPKAEPKPKAEATPKAKKSKKGAEAVPEASLPDEATEAPEPASDYATEDGATEDEVNDSADTSSDTSTDE